MREMDLFPYNIKILSAYSIPGTVLGPVSTNKMTCGSSLQAGPWITVKRESVNIMQFSKCII